MIEHVLILKSQDAQPACIQVLISYSILSLTERVRTPIELHHQRARGTIEVDNEFSNTVLPTKPQTNELIPAEV